MLWSYKVAQKERECFCLYSNLNVIDRLLKVEKIFAFVFFSSTLLVFPYFLITFLVSSVLPRKRTKTEVMSEQTSMLDTLAFYCSSLSGDLWAAENPKDKEVILQNYLGKVDKEFTTVADFKSGEFLIMIVKFTK